MRIKEQISPHEFYEYELNNVAFKQHGWNDGGLCPFHDDNKPGSFRINTETGAFNCFSCGTKGGDIIAFTMTLYNLSFREALEKLADDWGLI